MYTEKKAIFIDNSPANLRYFVTNLPQFGLRTKGARSVEEAQDCLERWMFDVTFMPFHERGGTIVENIAAVRSIAPDIPVVVRASRGEYRVRNVITALEMGKADQFIPESSSVELTAAYAKAVIRRTQSSKPLNPIVTAGTITINLDQKSVARDGAEVALTAQERNLLMCLASKPGKLFLHSELIGHLDGTFRREDPRDSLRMWVMRLRRKLEEDPAHPTILTLGYDMGYRLEAIASP